MDIENRNPEAEVSKTEPVKINTWIDYLSPCVPSCVIGCICSICVSTIVAIFIYGIYMATTGNISK